MPLKSCIPPLWGFSEVSLHYRKSTNYQSRETVKELATEVLFQRTMILSSVLFYILGRILPPPPHRFLLGIGLSKEEKLSLKFCNNKLQAKAFLCFV